MSPIGPENFQRLEEFSSFVSCIKCFGRSIIPPLLTLSRRQELKRLGIAAVKKEEEILKKKQHLNYKKQDVHISPEIHRDSFRPNFQTNTQESCALWYPSAEDCQQGISVAISKFPTSGIYSSVHTDAIVCSNVVESSSTYSGTIMRNSLLVPESSIVNCIECSHNNMNLECSFCQAESNQDFSKSFTSEVGPEVPCRTYSLLQQNVGIEKEESNCAVETDCESLPTVIFNQNCIPTDNDTESISTYMTQSTDLEKYMEFPCDSSPDNSAMYSKSACQHYMYSRSDDASSETIVNTENELTPCASTMAEITDNIEDELSNAEEVFITSDNKEVSTGTMKRAHSVDSYMKIIQACTKNVSVKKSRSDSFNADLKVRSDSDVEIKSPMSFKTGYLIKEDSKESDESKDVPEKDVSGQEEVSEILHNNDESLEIKDNVKSFQKKHVRQHSYTLDHPSSALILAHADCTCNFDANCISPHCSALADENKLKSAFIKETVEVSIPKSRDQLKNLSLLNSVLPQKDIAQNSEDMTATIDVFPIVNEKNSEKSDSGNAKESEIKVVPESVPDAEICSDLQFRKKTENIFGADKKPEHLKEVYEKLLESHEERVKKLFQEQHQEWLSLQEELKQEMLLYEKSLKPTGPLAGSPSKIEETNQVKGTDCCNREMIEKESFCEKESSISNSSNSSLNQIPNIDHALQQNLQFSIPSENLHSQSSLPENLHPPENFRASISPSRDLNTFSIIPSTALGNISNTHLFKESETSRTCSYKTSEIDSYSHGSKSFSNMNGLSRETPIFLPRSSCPLPPNVTPVPSSEKCDMYFCDSAAEQDKECTSVNGYCDCDINFSHSEYMPDVKINSVSSCNDLRISVHLSPQSHYSSVSTNNDMRNIVHLSPQSHNTSLISSVLSKNLEPEAVVNYQDSNCIAEKISSTSSFNSSELPNVMNEKASGDVALPVTKDEVKNPINNLFSLNAKTLKNGSFSPQDNSKSKRIIDDPVLLKKFEKLPAFVKGYLTRRFYKSERVQYLIKTLEDSAGLYTELSDKLTGKGNCVTEQDVSFHRQLLLEVISTFGKVNNILCDTTIKEKMDIIAESRKFRLRSRIDYQKPELDSTLLSHEPKKKHQNVKQVSQVADKASGTSKTHKLSVASVKSLERKKKSNINSRTYTKEDFRNARSRSVLEMRTYTIDDIPNFPGSLSSKSLSVSPSSGFKNSTSMKRKTSSAKSRQCLHHHKWVP